VKNTSFLNQPSDGLIHTVLPSEHWTRMMLPGMARVLRTYTEYGLINHSSPGFERWIERTQQPPLAVIGLFYKNSSKLMKHLSGQPFPIVNVSSADPPPEFPGVFVDNRAVGRMAADHLLKLGNRTFACLDVGGGRMSDLRCEGFRERIREVLPGTSVNQLSGLEEAFKPKLRQLPMPAALFCVTDNRARSAAKVAEELGLKIPRDLAILGVDNDPFECETTRVPLSSVAVPFDKIGERAMEILLRMLEGIKPVSRLTEIPPSHVETRLSTDPLVFDDKIVNQAVRILRQSDRPPPNVAVLSEELGISRRSLELHCRQAGAGTVHGLIHHIRMDRAAALLRDPRLSLVDVSKKIGIQNYSRFGQLFRERFGMSPREYRKRVR
jgi:LacI family transcriptional regulator